MGGSEKSLQEAPQYGNPVCLLQLTFLRTFIVRGSVRVYGVIQYAARGDDDCATLFFLRHTHLLLCALNVLDRLRTTK